MQICRAAPDISAPSCLQAAIQHWLLPSALPVAPVCGANPTHRCLTLFSLLLQGFQDTDFSPVLLGVEEKGALERRNPPPPCSLVLRPQVIDSGFACSVCTYVCAYEYMCIYMCVCTGIRIYISSFNISHQLVHFRLVSWVWLSQIYLEN